MWSVSLRHFKEAHKSTVKLTSRLKTISWALKTYDIMFTTYIRHSFGFGFVDQLKPELILIFADPGQPATRPRHNFFGLEKADYKLIISQLPLI